MNWFAFLLVYVLNVQGLRDFIDIKKIYLMENNFWCADHEQLRTDKENLYKVSICLERKNGFSIPFHYFSKTCYHLKSTNLGYVFIPGYWMINDINSYLKSPEDDEFLLKLRFLFTDELIDDFHKFGRYKGKVQEYVTYKLPETKLKGNNCISLKCGITKDLHLRHITEELERFLLMKPLKFNEYINFFDKIKVILSEIVNEADFKLYYFKDYFECFKNLKDFFKDLCYFKLLEDNVPDSPIAGFSNMSIHMKTTIFVSQFKEQIYENQRKLYDFQTFKVWKPLLDDFYNYIKTEILNNKIFLLIGDKYDINYYIDHLSIFFNELVKEKQEKFTTFSSEDKISIFYEMTNSLDLVLEKLQLKAVKDLSESVYVLKHFSKFFGKKIRKLDDCINFERIVCDYNNMFLYIFNIYYKFKKNSSIPCSYASPIFIDDYNLKIINGIKIEINWPAEFKQIRGFNDKGEEVLMEKDTDYFISNINILCCPSEALKMKNIQEIEILLFDDVKNSKRFKVNKYLNA